VAVSFPLKLLIKITDKATGPLGAFQKNLTTLARSSIEAGKKMTSAVTAPILALGGLSVAAFARFEQGMSNVSTLVDTGAESMQAMGAEVLAIGRRTPVALEDLTGALYDVRSAGVSAADQFKVLEGSARLAVAGLGTTKEAADIVTSAINAFGLAGAEADRVYNVIFQTTNKGKTTISQLAQGFGGVAGTVAAAGVKIDEYLSSVAALTTTGLPAAEAHTQLRAVIAGLTRQTSLTRAVFGKLGAKDFKALIATAGGLVPALEKIRGVLKNDDTNTLRLLGSTEALNAVLGLTGRQSGAFRDALAVMRDGSDGVTAAFAKQNATTQANLVRLKNNLEAVAVSLGQALLPVIERMVPLIERAAATWSGMSAESQNAILIAAGAAAALGPTLVVLGNLAVAVKAVTAAFVFAAGWGKYLWMMRASIMAGLVPSLSAAAASMWAFTAALLANPITWVVIAVAALAAAGYQVYKNWEPLKEFFAQLWDEPQAATQLFTDWLEDVFSGVFGRLWQYIKPVFDAVMWLSTAPLRSIIGGAKMLFGGAEQAAPMAAPAPLLGAERAVPATGGEARVTVDFANVPRGVRVDQDRGGTAPLTLDVGYAMGGL